MVVVRDGAEAICAYQTALDDSVPFELVMMDLTIPGGMGGQEAVKEILAINPDAKVLVSSGYSNDLIMARYMDYGFCAAIVKPYQLKELDETLQKVLS